MAETSFDFVPIPGLKIEIDPSGLVIATADGGLYVAVDDPGNLWAAISEALDQIKAARAHRETPH